MPLRALSLAVLIVAVATVEANPVGLSTEQLRRLEWGEVILLDALPTGGGGRSSQGGTAMAVVKASPETVWQVLVDYPRHRGLYPRVVVADVLEADAAHTLVRYVVGVGPLSWGFHVDNHADVARWRLEWQLAQERQNDLFIENRGYWQIAPRGEDVVLTYAMAARTVLPAFMTRGATKDGLVETIKAVRERAEQQR